MDIFKAVLLLVLNYKFSKLIYFVTFTVSQLLWLNSRKIFFSRNNKFRSLNN